MFWTIDVLASGDGSSEMIQGEDDHRCWEGRSVLTRNMLDLKGFTQKSCKPIRCND